MSKIVLGRAENGEQVSIDIQTLISTRMLVTASSGGGKSETLRRILEEAVAHVQCIVIDPEGEFSTLREKKPFVLVGEGGETPADIRTAALVATRLLELNASAVCDIYEMRVHERHEWVKRFLDALVHAPKALWHPVLIVVDEAHTYCPEHGYGESVASQAIIDLCNLGRKRGFSAILATQRLSKLSKNAAEPLQNYLVGRTTFDDQKRAAATFKIDPGVETRKFSLELERLKDGQFICRGRALSGDMQRVQVIRGETRPPKTGTAMAGVVTPTPEAIKALLPKLADLPHEAEKKAKTEADLKRELTEARRRITELERVAFVEPTQKMTPDVDEVRSIVSKEMDRIVERVYHVAGMKMKDAMMELAEKLENGSRELRSRALELGQRSEWEVEYFSDDSMAAMKRIKMVPETFTVEKVQFDTGVKFEPKPLPVVFLNGAPLRKGARNMLACLCQWMPSGRTEAQLATQVQMKRTGGTWAAYKSDLTKGGYVTIQNGMWFATESGRAYLGANVPDTPTTTREVVQLWGEKLRKGAREMLDVLVELRGRNISRDQLGERVSMEPTGGTFSAYLSDLKQAGLIEVDRDGVRADREALLL